LVIAWDYGKITLTRWLHGLIAFELSGDSTLEYCSIQL